MGTLTVYLNSDKVSIEMEKDYVFVPVFQTVLFRNVCTARTLNIYVWIFTCILISRNISIPYFCLHYLHLSNSAFTNTSSCFLFTNVYVMFVNQ